VPVARSANGAAATAVTEADEEEEAEAAAATAADGIETAAHVAKPPAHLAAVASESAKAAAAAEAQVQVEVSVGHHVARHRAIARAARRQGGARACARTRPPAKSR
jgi:hypothetical protein